MTTKQLIKPTMEDFRAAIDHAFAEIPEKDGPHGDDPAFGIIRTLRPQLMEIVEKLPAELLPPLRADGQAHVRASALQFIVYCASRLCRDIGVAEDSVCITSRDEARDAWIEVSIRSIPAFAAAGRQSRVILCPPDGFSMAVVDAAVAIKMPKVLVDLFFGADIISLQELAQEKVGQIDAENEKAKSKKRKNAENN